MTRKMSGAERQRKSAGRKRLEEKHGQGVDAFVTINDSGTARVWHWRGGRWHLEGVVVTGGISPNTGA